MAQQKAQGLRLPGLEGAGDPTIAFYEREAEAYFQNTVAMDLSSLHRLFLGRLPPGGLILDAGSGSGRDTLAFLDAGFRVEAFDASGGLAELAEAMTGVIVDVIRFEQWRAATRRYDGIWCFASLLHVAHDDLPAVLRQLTTSLKPGGSLFASFKEGGQPSVDRTGRRFTNLTVEAARSLFGSVEGIECTEVWEETGPTALSDPTSWIYALSRHTD